MPWQCFVANKKRVEPSVYAAFMRSFVVVCSQQQQLGGLELFDAMHGKRVCACVMMVAPPPYGSVLYMRCSANRWHMALAALHWAWLSCLLCSVACLPHPWSLCRAATAGLAPRKAWKQAACCCACRASGGIVDSTCSVLCLLQICVGICVSCRQHLAEPQQQTGSRDWHFPACPAMFCCSSQRCTCDAHVCVCAALRCGMLRCEQCTV
jgi:hypothetical protein